MRRATSHALESRRVRPARGRRRHLRPCLAPTMRQAADCGSRSSRPAISAAARRSTIRRPRTAVCGRFGSGDLRRARESIHERRALARIAPWFLRPLPFLVGTYRSMTKSRLALGAAFRLDAWLGRHRNDGVEPELHLPAPRLVSKAATLQLFRRHPPGRTDRRRAVVRLPDGRERPADDGFCRRGGSCRRELANHAEAIEALRQDGRVAGMRVRTRSTEHSIEVRARMTLNAAGSRRRRSDGDCSGCSRPFPLVKAMNLVTSKPASDMALAAPGRERPHAHARPVARPAIVGTSQSATFAHRATPAVAATEMAALDRRRELRVPGAAADAGDVTLVHRGVVPAVSGRDNVPDLKPSHDILDHAADGIDGAMTVVGAKYTTARGVAEKVTTVIARRLDRRVAPSRTATTTLPGAGIADHEALAIETARDIDVEVPLPVIRHLIALYAEAAPHSHQADAGTCRARPPRGGRRRHTRCRGAPRHPSRDGAPARRHRRPAHRSGLGKAAARRRRRRECARIAAAELGWDADRTAQEIAAVKRLYDVDG